jgi:hypothetical protein
VTEERRAERAAEPALDELLESRLLVPIRSSGGTSLDDATGVPNGALRHGTDDRGARFLAAFTSPETFGEFGPPGSDHVVMPAHDLFQRAERLGERVVVDPGAPGEVDVPVGVLPFLAAGISPRHPDALRARRPLGELLALEAPTDVPEPFGGDLRRTLASLPQVQRAWLLWAGTTWAIGVEPTPESGLAEFDEVRNKLHALATGHLGSRRMIVVTDLRAQALREQYAAVAPPFHEAPQPGRGFLARLFGG